MHSALHFGLRDQQETSDQETVLQPLADSPFEQCAAIELGMNELERRNRMEAQLRDALAREEVLLGEKEQLITHKDLMSRESDHRLLNGLQMVASLLSMQSRLAGKSPAAEQLKIAADRVATISSVHKRLHALDHVGRVELKQFLASLCQDMAGILPGKIGQSRVTVEGIALEVPTFVGIPLGYVVSELVTNCAKYTDSPITVTLGANPDGGYELSVSDNGPGLPKGFDPKKSKGLGMKIVSSLVSQIHGHFRFGSSGPGGGARFAVFFRLDERAAESVR